MNAFVVDASVVVKWFLPEVHHDAARRLHHSDADLHAPDFMVLEVTNVLCKRMRRGELPAQAGDAILNLLRVAPVQLESWQFLLNEAYDIAKQTGRSLYDCLYLALAKVLDAAFVTADRKLYEALHRSSPGVAVRWVEELV